MGERIKTLWRWISNISTVQFVWSLLGGAVMGVLTWLKDQPVWFVAFVALASFALISFIWAQVVIARRDSGRGSETKAPANKLPKMRATEMAADEVNRAVRSAEPAQSPNPMANVFGLKFKHMFEQIAAEMEVSHATELDEIRGRTAPIPQRDKTLHDGLFYASEGVWPVPEGGTALPNNFERYSEILDELHQLARDGDITVWARPQRWQNSGVHEPIPCDQWGIGLVYILDTFTEDCPMKRRENGYRIFVRLMVSSAEFERRWPHD